MYTLYTLPLTCPNQNWCSPLVNYCSTLYNTDHCSIISSFGLTVTVHSNDNTQSCMYNRTSWPKFFTVCALSIFCGRSNSYSSILDVLEIDILNSDKLHLSSRIQLGKTHSKFDYASLLSSFQTLLSQPVSRTLASIHQPLRASFEWHFSLVTRILVFANLEK